MTVIPFRRHAPAKSNKGSPASMGSEGYGSSFAAPPEGVPALGIDLGTTNSVASVYTRQQDHPRSLEFEGAPLVPSMLHVGDPSGDVLLPASPVVGRMARERLSQDASGVIRSTKRDMGRPGRLFSSGGVDFSAEDAAREILSYLGRHDELVELRALYGGLWAVITVPAHFDDAARQATIASASDAGLNVLRIINEPTAAALAYSMLPDVRHTDSELLAVFDFGGGTFDVSIVEREGLVFNVLSSEGDVELGGDDFDVALARHLLESVQPVLTARRASEDSDLFRNLLVLAEEAKKALQEEGETRVSGEDLDGHGARVDVTMTRDTFEALVSPLVQRTLELTERAVHAARKRPAQISRILLVGGSTRVTLVQKMLQGYFPSCLVDARLEPDLAVSWGAAVQAAIILGFEPDTILVDVCSHTLGIGVAEDSLSVTQNFKEVCKRFGITQTVNDARLAQILGPRLQDFNTQLQSLLRVAPIIHRNSPLPSRKSEFFSTLYHNQAAVQVVVVQGDEATVGANRLIGGFLFELQQPCPAGTRCEIQLTYDSNGMVHVLAKQLGTDNAAEAQFDSRTGEVKGWVSVTHESADAESSDAESVNVGSAEGVARVTSLFGAQRHLNSSPFPSVLPVEDPSDRDILNGLLLRLRRRLATLSVSDSRAETMSRLERAYTTLLKEALLGHENDTLIDAAEAEILAMLELQDP